MLFTYTVSTLKEQETRQHMQKKLHDGHYKWNGPHKIWLEKFQHKKKNLTGRSGRPSEFNAQFGAGTSRSLG